MSTNTKKTANPLSFGLALTAGLGLVLMILGLGFGVVQGDTADNGAVGAAFAFGLVLLVLGVIGWVAVAQPYKHFDDINEPKYTGHHDHDSHAIILTTEHDTGNEPGIVITTAHTHEPHAPSHS